MSNYLPTVFGENLVDVFDDFDRNFFRGFGNIDHTLYGKHAQNLMKTDVKETEDGYEVDVDLPGFKKEDIKLDVENDVLTISAEHSYDSKDDEKAEEKSEKGKKNYVKRERYYGSYTRSFDVSAVEVDKIEAEYSDGVLKLTMPKKAALIPASRRLEIK